MCTQAEKHVSTTSVVTGMFLVINKQGELRLVGKGGGLWPSQSDIPHRLLQTAPTDKGAREMDGSRESARHDQH